MISLEDADFVEPTCRVPENPDGVLTDKEWEEITVVLHDRGLSTEIVDILRLQAMTARTLANLDFSLYTELLESGQLQPRKTVGMRDTLVAIRVLNEWGRVRAEG